MDTAIKGIALVAFCIVSAYAGIGLLYVNQLAGNVGVGIANVQPGVGYDQPSEPVVRGLERRAARN